MNQLDWSFCERLAQECELAIGHAACEAAGVEKIPLEFVWGPMVWLYGSRWAEGCFLLPEGE